jgi:multidrug efflux pump
MNVSAPFIRRPVATTLLTVGLALAGAVAFERLAVSPLPQVDFPTIMVSALLPGASPQTMATSVAVPLERQFGRIAGVTEITSASVLGATGIVLQFDLDRNIDGAARDVQAAIAAAQGFLPPTLPSNPTYRKVNPADAPILIVALTSETLSPPQLYDAASTLLQQRLSQVEGVGQVIAGGSSLPAVRLEVNPTAASSYGIGLEALRRVVADTTVSRPTGELSDGARRFVITTNDQLRRAEEYRPLVVDYRAGAAVRLADLAEVDDSMEDVRTAGLVNGKPAVLLVLFRQPGANIIETVDRVRGLLPQLEASIPRAIKLSVVLDRTPTIRGSLKEVERALAISAVLVILVVFVFLRNVRATLIPAVAVPVSLIATFAVMYLCDYSLDNLSLMALTIATGFVVDDAIVVLENTMRHIDDGLPPRAAAFLGAREIAFTILSMSLSLVAVFTPILLMGGMLGRLFREFAVTLSTAIMVSMAVSLSTTPMMCAALLQGRGARRPGRLYRASERAFAALRRAYGASLSRVLGHPWLMLSAFAATLALNVYLFAVVPKGFFPDQDTGRLTGIIQAAQDISFQAMHDKLLRIGELIAADPAVDTVTAFIGGGGAGATRNVGRMFIGLKPLEERRLSAGAVIARLRPRLAAVPGAPTYLQAVQDLRVGAVLTTAQYQFTLQGDSLTELNQWAPRVEGQLRALPGLVDVSSDQQIKGLQAMLAIDRHAASRLGITAQLIDDTLYDAFGQRQVAVTYTMLNQYHVVMEVAPRFWQRPASLHDIYVNPASAEAVPLEVFTSYQPGTTALAANHRGQFPSVTLSFNLASGVALGQAVSAIEAMTRTLGMPASIRGSFAGTAQAFKDSLATEPLLIGAALIAVYVVLGILYESYVHPLTILSTLPSAGVGALVALLLTRTELSVVALIGIILLIGIVKKNAIMMVDMALEAERSAGKSSLDAIHEACLLRFRPIMMTTMAALLGALPLALGTGVGSELRRPLAIAIVGGLLFSQLLTLYTTPVIYLTLDRLRLWLAYARRSRRP